MAGRTSPIGKVCHCRRVATCALASFILAVIGTGPLQRSAHASFQLDASTRENVRQVISAVGIVFARNSTEPPDQFPRLRGSGVLVRSDGVIITNYHVIRHDDDEGLYDELYFSLPALISGKTGESNRFRLSILVTSKKHDLALLKITSDRQGRPIPDTTRFPTIEIGDTRKLKLMDDLIIIGYPGKAGSDVTVNKGMVEGIDTVNEWIKTDARLMRGNSGGAGVDREGKLVGIPSKVVIDTQSGAKAADPDQRPLGAVGFLRPSYLVSALLEKIGDSPAGEKVAKLDTQPSQDADSDRPESKPGKPAVLVRGVIRSAVNSQPIAGARIGLVPVGTETVTAKNLVAWGGTDSEGRFELNNPVPPGRYTIKAVAFGYVPLSSDVEITTQSARLELKLKPSS